MGAVKTLSSWAGIAAFVGVGLLAHSWCSTRRSIQEVRYSVAVDISQQRDPFRKMQCLVDSKEASQAPASDASTFVFTATPDFDKTQAKLLTLFDGDLTKARSVATAARALVAEYHRKYHLAGTETDKVAVGYQFMGALKDHLEALGGEKTLAIILASCTGNSTDPLVPVPPSPPAPAASASTTSGDPAASPAAPGAVPAPPAPAAKPSTPSKKHRAHTNDNPDSMPL